MNSGRKVSAVSKSEETENPNSPATVKYVESLAWKLLLPDAPAQPQRRPPTTEQTTEDLPPAGPPQTHRAALHPAAEANELQPHTRTARNLRKIL